MEHLTWGRSLTHKIRLLHANEKTIITELLRIAQCETDELDNVAVVVIDDDTGTLRSSHLEEKQRIKAVSDTHFSDTDGGYVEAILFVDSDRKFGELAIWKADGSKQLKLPDCLSKFDEIKVISST